MRILFVLLLSMTTSAFALSEKQKEARVKKLRENVCASDSQKKKTEAVGACPECAKTKKAANSTENLKIDTSSEEIKQRDLTFFRLMKETNRFGSSYGEVCKSIESCEELIKKQKEKSEIYEKKNEEAQKKHDEKFEDFNTYLDSDLKTTPMPKGDGNFYSSYATKVFNKIYHAKSDPEYQKKVQQAYGAWAGKADYFLTDDEVIAQFVEEGKKLQKSTFEKPFSGYSYSTKQAEAKLKELKEKKPPASVEEEMKEYEKLVEDETKNIKYNDGFQRCDLSWAELFALRDYTGNGFGIVNPALRAGGENAAKYEVYKQVLNSALAKIRRYNGFVNRGANLPEEVAKQYQVGAIIDSPAFTSTSAFEGFEATYKFSIKSKTGSYIAPFSGSSGEEEVLIPAGVKFKVLERKKGKGGETRLVLEEVGS